MPVFNAQRFVKKAIQSVLDQTYKDFELIIIDDCSTDASRKMTQSFKDKRIIYTRNEENLGVTKSLNRALQIAKGEFIARLDADDIANPQRFTKQISFFNTHRNIGVVGSWVALVDEGGKFIGVKKYPLRYENIKRAAVLYNPLNHSSVMMRRSIIKRYGRYDEQLNGAEDYDLWLRILPYTKIENIPEPLINYRLVKQSVSFGAMQRVERAFAKAKIKSVFVYHYPIWHFIFVVKSFISFLIPTVLKRKMYERYLNY